MGASFKFELKGLQETLKKLGDEGKKIGMEIDDELSAGAVEIELESIQRISTTKNSKGKIAVDTGRLKNSIRSKRLKEYSYTVGAYTDYAAYIEFGTGGYAASYVPSIDSEWQKIAESFMKSGNGAMEQRPYLYPSYKRLEPIIIKRIDNILKKDVRL